MRSAFGIVSILLNLATPILGATVNQVSKDATCGKASGFTCQGSQWGNCCSKNNWCGSSKEYCGTGCQLAFGQCDGSILPTSKSATSRSTTTTSVASSSSSSSMISTTTSSSTSPTSIAIPSCSCPTPTATPSNTYIRRHLNPQRPACAYDRPQALLDYQVVTSDLGPNNDYAPGLAQCQAQCDRNPACVFYFLFISRSQLVLNNNRGQCVISNQPFQSESLFCGYDSVTFSAGYDQVPRGGGSSVVGSLTSSSIPTTSSSASMATTS